MYPQDGTIFVWLLPLPRKGEHANGAPLGNTTSRERAFAEAAQEEEKKNITMYIKCGRETFQAVVAFRLFFFSFLYGFDLPNPT